MGAIHMAIYMEKIIELNGEELTFDIIDAVTYKGAQVVLGAKAQDTMKRARALLLELGEKGEKIYGMNTGVGWNKDKKIDSSVYRAFNERLLRSHMIGIEPYCTEEEIRAILLVRLQGFIKGYPGVDPDIAMMFVELLNRRIHPLIFARGSIGEADIGTLSAVGLALIGEGEVLYKGERMSAVNAFCIEGLQPIFPGAKDGLSIVSSNAQSAALASLAVLEAKRFFSLLLQVFCLSLEGFNGVVAPLEEMVNQARGYKGQNACARICRMMLKGSYLYQKDENRALQDPLSFRSHCAVAGAALDALDYFKEQLRIELDGSDDNPCLSLELGRICGSANFEPLAWVLGAEMLCGALSHVSKMIANQTIHLSNPAFTKLPRFLAPDDETIAFGTIQKTLGVLDAENRAHANPSSMDYLQLAGNIEDHGTNAVFAVQKVRSSIDNCMTMLAIECMHAAQAVDFRMPVTLGAETKNLYEEYRRTVPHLEKDRNLSVDIMKTKEFLKKWGVKQNE